jgi:hypothetical protein
MSESILKKYLVTCIPEGIRVTTDYRETIPTVCPNDKTHAIDPDSIVEIDIISPNTVSIKQSDSKFANGSFRVKYYDPTFVPGVSFFDFKYDYPVSLYSTTIIPTSENIGDSLDVLTAPDTVVGAIQSDLQVGSSLMSIGDVTPIYIGYMLTITDGVNTNDLGEVIGKNETLNTLRFSKPTTNSFSAISPSYVMITVPRIENMMIINTQDRILGSTILNAATLPKGVVIRLKYTNNGLVPKKLCFSVDIKIIKTQE